MGGVEGQEILSGFQAFPKMLVIWNIQSFPKGDGKNSKWKNQRNVALHLDVNPRVVPQVPNVLTPPHGWSATDPATWLYLP